MALLKRGEIYHYDFTYKGERYRGSTGHTKKGRAERYVERFRDSLKLGTPSGRKTHTLGEAADKWFASQVVGKKSELTTAQRLKILFRHVDPALPVSDIGAAEVSDAILTRRIEPIRQGSPKNPRYPTNGTVNRDIIDTTLRPILNFAEEALEEKIKRIRWAKLRLAEPKERVRNFTDQEMGAWREALPEWHRPPFDFIARYGVRLNEAFFPPSAVNVERCEITLFDTKNGTDHQLTVLEVDMPDLAARKARAETAGLETIWFKDEKGELTPTHWRAFQSASRAAIEKAGIINARPVHDLRHHAATTLHRATGNLKLVQDLLNHSSIASSARYAHTNKDDLRKALKTAYGTKPTTSSVTVAENRVESKAGRGT